jgi:GAF domain-containing protein
MPVDDMGDREAEIRSLIAGRWTGSDETVDYLRRVCESSASTLSASGAGISVMTEAGVRGLSAASDPLSRQIEELQFVLGEGPCMDAFETRRPVLIADLGEDAMTRWPVYAPAARAAGARAVFAFPLQIGGARLGVLDVFRDRTGALSADQVTDALTFAEVTVTALLDRQERAGAHDATDGMVEGVAHRAELFQAQGMVMVQLGVTIGEALVRMRAYAYAEDRDLGEVARDVVARRLRFDRDQS